MTTIERIIDLVQKSGKSENSLKKEMGLPNGAFSDWKAGRAKPSADALAKIADYFGVTVDYLLGRTNYDQALPTGAIAFGDHHVIPILGSVRAGPGGHWEEDLLGYETVDASSIHGCDISDLFWLRVVGDSMAPKIEQGDLVLVQKVNSVDNNTLAAVAVDDEEAVIKIVKYGKTWIELHSANPHYPPRRFQDADVLRVYIIGRVRQRLTKF